MHLKISATTVMARILEISKNITAPQITAGSVYEVDEIKTFVGRKKDHVWIAYALNRKDKSVAGFSVGPRTNETLRRVLDKISNAKRIYTDKLRQYKTLIPRGIHKTTNRGTNHIERHNLTIRTHIKRDPSYHLFQSKDCDVVCRVEDLFLGVNNHHCCKLFCCTFVMHLFAKR